MSSTPAKIRSRAPVIAFAAWIVPGLGHLLLGRWIRGVLFLLATGGLALTGCLMRGAIFSPRSGDPFSTLGFLADVGSGIFYVFCRLFESGGPDLTHAAGDYGTRFLAAAGIVNFAAVADACQIACAGRN